MVDAPSLRIVYFGTPAFAVPTLTALIRSRHKVVTLVSQPDRPKGRGHHVAATPTKEVAVLTGIPVLQPTRLRDDAFLAAIADLRPDLGVVAAYGRLLPDALLRIPRLGMINVHGSLLPKYRGAAPVHRAVIAGDTVTGVTIMRVVTELDAGPMMAAVTVPIAPDDTSLDVENSLATSGATLLVDVVDHLSRGPIPEVVQDEAAATYAPKLLKSESPIDWSLSAIEIHNRVRGLQPWPMASASVNGMRVVIHRTRVETARTGQRAGEVIEAQGDVLTVAAGDGGLLRILEIQQEGRRVMQAREFLNGRRLSPGVVLSAG
jgi:methionyl-tRNA formyltransferase